MASSRHEDNCEHKVLMPQVRAVTAWRCVNTDRALVVGKVHAVQPTGRRYPLASDGRRSTRQGVSDPCGRGESARSRI